MTSGWHLKWEVVQEGDSIFEIVFRSHVFTSIGSLLVTTGLLVDHASVCAEPHATRLIFLPCKAATNLGLCIALVLPSPEIIKLHKYFWNHIFLK